MKSSEMRNNALFTRNQFNPVGKWNIPLVKKQEIPSCKKSSKMYRNSPQSVPKKFARKCTGQWVMDLR